MRGMNRVTLVGNLGNAPDVKELETGKVVAKASLATTEVYRIGADTRAETQWHTVLFWGRWPGSLKSISGKGAISWWKVRSGTGITTMRTPAGDTLRKSLPTG